MSGFGTCRRRGGAPWLLGSLALTGAALLFDCVGAEPPIPASSGGDASTVESGADTGAGGDSNVADSGPTPEGGTDTGADQQCPAGSHECGGKCSSNASTASCGTSCTACPVPTNGSATCNGTACGIACKSPQSACGSACVNTHATDANNCGSCGHGCLGGTCVAGVCQAFVIAQYPTSQDPQGMASDGLNVVWTDNGSGVVTQAPVTAGGTPIPINKIAGGSYGPVAVAGGKVAWTYQSSGAAPPQLWLGTEGHANSGGVAGSSIANGFVGAIGMDPSATRQFFTVAPGATKDVYFCNAVQCSIISSSTSTGLGQSVVANATDAYWTDPPNGNVSTYNYATSMNSIFQTGQNKPDLVAIDSAYAYWTTGAPSIVRKALSGGAVVSVVPTPVATPGALTTDGTNVYYGYSAGTGFGIATAPVGGGTSTVIWSSPSAGASWLKVGNGALVWCDQNSFVIYGMRYP